MDSPVVLAVMVALCERLFGVAALLFLCGSCVSPSSGGVMDGLLSSSGEALVLMVWAGGSFVAGMSTRYLVGLLLNAA